MPSACRRSWTARPFIHFCGMRVTALDPAAGRVVLAIELRPELERRQGTGEWRGGAIAGLIDTAGDAAVALGLGAVVPTINFRVDYLRPATTRHLTATATVRRAGRTVAIVDIDVEDAEGRLVAVGRGCFGAQPAWSLSPPSPFKAPARGRRSALAGARVPVLALSENIAGLAAGGGPPRMFGT